ncbi:hypothetical protein HED60_14070 [Planctomycetales bacterium ZRK34]|nr:hypothetical protein HED60_14070 [Planctomycetales bacterium ZRK34]
MFSTNGNLCEGRFCGGELEPGVFHQCDPSVLCGAASNRDGDLDVNSPDDGELIAGGEAVHGADASA